MAYAHLWSAAVEHQFTPELIGAVEYTGSKGVNLYTIDRLNIPGSALVYAGTGSASTRINPQYSYINFRTNGGYSNYDGVNFRLEMRNFARKGLTLRANYTWSHALDNLSNTFSETASSPNLGLLDPLHPGLDYGSADYDVRHRFTLAAVWELPYKGNNAVEKQVLGGWSVIPNFSARTGIPFSLWDCTNAGYQLRESTGGRFRLRPVPSDHDGAQRIQGPWRVEPGFCGSQGVCSHRALQTAIPGGSVQSLQPLKPVRGLLEYGPLGHQLHNGDPWRKQC
jgi:hypothetical protein